MTRKEQTKGPLEKGQELQIDHFESWFFIILLSSDICSIDMLKIQGTSGAGFGTSLSSGSLHCIDWHSWKIQKSSTVFHHSHDLTQIFRRFASGEILWPLLISVTPHRAAACITFGSCFKPECTGLVSTDFGLLLGTVSCRGQPGLSYSCKCHVKRESFQTKGLQNKSPSKFIARNQNRTAIFLLAFQGSVRNFVSILSIRQEHWIAQFFKVQSRLWCILFFPTADCLRRIYFYQTSK